MCVLGNVKLARERKKIKVWHIRDVRKTGQVRKIIFKGKDCSVSANITYFSYYGFVNSDFNLRILQKNGGKRHAHFFFQWP